VFATGQGRKTDPVDAHSVAIAALRAKGSRQVVVDDETVALRLLVDRRDELGRARTDLVNRIHKLLLELLPGRGEDLTVRRPGSCPAQHHPTSRPPTPVDKRVPDPDVLDLP
jgi:transposase